MPATTKPLKELKPGMGLYQVFYWPKKAPDPSKPWAVANLETGDVNGRWHSTKEEALAQAKALYASLGDKAKVHSEQHSFMCFADTAQISAEDGLVWLEAIEAKTYQTPSYGAVPISEEKILNFVNNFHDNVRGQDIATNYDHGVDVSKGNKASGWIRDARYSNGKLMLGVDFTDPARQEIKAGEWKYFSLEWEDEWVDNDGNIFQDVMVGGALTNRPIAKKLMPVNFSELFVEQADLEFAVWSTAYVNNLPDSCFLYIESGGKKDAQGRTEPRSLRHLPFKDASGKVDLPHLRNAIARIPQMSGISDSTKASLQSKAREMLKGMGGSMGESKELEHSEPGTGNPPAPRTDGDGHDDKDRVEGWRRETPPIALEDGQNFSEAEARGYLDASLSVLKRQDDAGELIEKIENLLALDSATISFNELGAVLTEVRNRFRGSDDTNDISTLPKGGNVVGELTEKDLRELRNVLDVDDDGQLLEAAKIKFGELTALREAVSASDQERIFAEQYPQYYAEHMRLMERDRNNAAKNFAESVAKVRKTEGYGLKETRQGLSVAALEKVQEAHKKFSEGRGTVEDFETCMKAIVNGGIVQFGEIGSSSDDALPEIDTSSAVGVAGARKIFAEVVAKIQRENPDKSYMECVEEASKKHPDLAESYKLALPA